MFFNNQPRRKLIPQGQPTKQQQHEQYMIIAILHHVGSPALGWYVKYHISLLYLIRNQYNKVLCYATLPHLRQGRSQQRSSTPIAIFCDSSRARTCDPRVKGPLLYQLSYRVI